MPQVINFLTKRGMASKALYVGGFAAAAYGLYYVLSQKNTDPNAPTKKNPAGGGSNLPSCDPTDPDCVPIHLLPNQAEQTYQTSTAYFPRTGFCGINQMWLPPNGSPPFTMKVPLITWAPEMGQYDSLSACLGRQEPRDSAAKYHTYGEGFWDSADWPTSSVVWVTPYPYWEGDPGVHFWDPSFPEPPTHHGCYWMSPHDGVMKHGACGYIIPAGGPDVWANGQPAKTYADWFAEAGGWS